MSRTTGTSAGWTSPCRASWPTLTRPWRRWSPRPWETLPWWELSAWLWGRRCGDEEPDLPRLGFYCVIRSAGYFGWRLKRFQYHLHPSHRLPHPLRSEDHGSRSNIPQLGGPGGSCRHPHFTKFCHGLLDHVANGVNSVNNSLALSLDFISIHKKGDKGSLKVLSKLFID